MSSIDYNAWAVSYDSTRRAGDSVVRAILDALGPAAGRTLLDIGAGTGNFAVALARAGFSVVLCDASPGMLTASRAKLPTVPRIVANAERLPLRDSAFSCAVCINVLPHIGDRRAALKEARRVLGGGCLVIRTATSESDRSHWAHAYFPTLVEHQPARKTEKELMKELQRAGFTRIAVSRFWYQGDSDGSFQALKYQPAQLLEAAANQRLAVFKRLPPPDLRAGVEALQRDLDSGRLGDVVESYRPMVERYGDGVVVAAR